MMTLIKKLKSLAGSERRRKAGRKALAPVPHEGRMAVRCKRYDGAVRGSDSAFGMGINQPTVS